jgi:probable phosphoglycerate mutase
MPLHLYYVRHGETEWSKSGRHTGRTDLPLTEQGERNARRMGDRLKSVKFARVFTSPRLRARQTCGSAGLGGTAEVEEDLAEWDYGDYEGRRTEDIHRERPGWSLFRDGCPGGESTSQVSDRADRLIARLRKLDGNIALFSHGHFGRVLAARWVELPVVDGERFLLDTASLGAFAYEHDDPASPVIALWNESC